MLKIHAIVAIDSGANKAFIVENVGGVPWSRISDIAQFEQDLAHLSNGHLSLNPDLSAYNHIP